MKNKRIPLLCKPVLNIMTTKANGLVPFDYINYLLSEIPILQADNTIVHLLPWEFVKR
ncbi:MAG: hypothetical protein ACJA13_003866 [Paraglaciecola sp.]|jgi:hypothetical protein